MPVRINKNLNILPETDKNLEILMKEDIRGKGEVIDWLVEREMERRPELIHDNESGKTPAER